MYIKSLALSVILASSLTAKAQKSPEINTNTPASQIAQGVFTSAIVNLSLNSLQKGENKLITSLVSIASAVAFEGLLNKQANLKSCAYVGLGAVTVNVTIELFRGNNRRSCVTRHW